MALADRRMNCKIKSKKMKIILLNLLCMIVLLNVTACTKKTGNPDVEKNALSVELILPNVASAGSTVKIQGSGFGDNPAGIQVRFGEVMGEVLDLSDGVISVKVPELADGSKINVSVLVGGNTSNIKTFRVRKIGEVVLAQKDTVEWTENKSPNIAAIKAGIPAYGERVVKYIRNEQQLLEIELSEPVIVAVADRELPWDFQFSQYTTFTVGSDVCQLEHESG